LAARISATSLSVTPGPAVARGVLFYLGVFAPALVALLLAAIEGGRRAADELVQQIAHAPAKIGWYIFAAGYLLTIKLIMAVIYRLWFHQWPQFGDTPWFLIVVAIAVSTWVQAGEEIGWRGYALPRLSARIGLAGASIVLGIIWASWHLPLFFQAGTDTYGQSFPVYLLQVTALSVVMAWLYWRTGRSLLLVMLMHAAVNNTSTVVPSSFPGANNAFSWQATPQAWITLALLWASALPLLYQMRGDREILAV
jgi:membrane protease YdiL (CAAX protease family)